MWLKIQVSNNTVSMFDSSLYSKIYLEGSVLYGTLKEAKEETVRACDGGWSSVTHSVDKLFSFISLEDALKSIEQIYLSISEVKSE